MDAYNWERFTARINIKAPVDSIYKMWATAANIEKWFLRQCEITNQDGQAKAADDMITTGDHFLWRWHGYPDDTEQRGKILDADGSSQVQFTFAQKDAEYMTCTVKIYAEEEENLCEIIQENIPDNETAKANYHLGCLTGWSFYLANMKSILEGGVDLRNKNERLKKMINS